MELVLAAYHLNRPGGSQTYLLTAADHLQRLGHQVTLFTHDAGPLAEVARDRGLVVADDLGDLPAACDGLLTQDSVCAYELAARYEATPQVFVSHGSEADMELPPQLPGTVAALVALSDRAARRLEGMALEADIVRLRQPIDFQRFRPRPFARRRPERAVLLGNHLADARRDMVTSALDRAAIRWEQLGQNGEVTLAPEDVLAGADIVIGYGRSLLEGMCAGCAAYLLEHSGDGWVTPAGYPALESDGFAGMATDEIVDGERLASDLAAFDPGMGVVNRNLVIQHHNPFHHAADLAALLKRVAPGRTPATVSSELERMARRLWDQQLRAQHFVRETGRLGDLANETARRAVASERRALEAEGRLAEIKRSRRYRLAQRVARPVESLRAVGSLRRRGRRT
jgi:hypothetical protein